MVQKGLILWEFTVRCFYRKLYLKWFVSLQCVGSFVSLLGKLAVCRQFCFITTCVQTFSHILKGYCGPVGCPLARWWNILGRDWPDRFHWQGPNAEFWTKDRSRILLFPYFSLFNCSTDFFISNNSLYSFRKPWVGMSAYTSLESILMVWFNWLNTSQVWLTDQIYFLLLGTLLTHYKEFHNL